jgi:putative PIN family toxin of toxin-antitoxin system
VITRPAHDTSVRQLPLRIVLDTNILISACLKPQGLEARVLDIAFHHALFVTDAVLAEYRDVASRAKFAAIRACLESALLRIEASARLVQPLSIESAAIDEDDNRLLECARAAQARYLITGNLKDYPSDFPGVMILNARAFLESIG